MDEAKLKKLPKWAQDEINLLESKIDYITKKYDDMFGKTVSNTQLSGYNDTKQLPNNCTVKFILSKHNYIECNIVDEELRIYGSRGVFILPRASNSFYIKGEEL